MVDQNLAHDLRRDAHEVRAAAIIGLLLLYQPGIGLVDQGSRLQRMARALVTHVASRQPSQFGIKQGYQTVERALVP